MALSAVEDVRCFNAGFALAFVAAPLVGGFLRAADTLTLEFLLELVATGLSARPFRSRAAFEMVDDAAWDVLRRFALGGKTECSLSMTAAAAAEFFVVRLGAFSTLRFRDLVDTIPASSCFCVIAQRVNSTRLLSIVIIMCYIITAAIATYGIRMDCKSDPPLNDV